MAKKLKHDVYVEELCNQIRPRYDRLLTNVRLFSTARKPLVIAEIDVLARKGKMVDIYEVKCSYRITKARKQLQRICKLIPQVNNAYFFCGSSGVLKTIERKVK